VAAIPKFAGVTPAPALVATQVADLREKMAATGPGSKAAMHASMLRLADTLSLFATNLNDTANVTAAELAATLLPLAKERERTTEPPNAPTHRRSGCRCRSRRERRRDRGQGIAGG
jgi:hypothetical protein